MKAPLLLEGKYQPSFPLRLMHKDVALALDLAKELGVSLPAGTAAREVYSSVLKAAPGRSRLRRHRPLLGKSESRQPVSARTVQAEKGRKADSSFRLRLHSE